MKLLICITGQTAAGKTKLALDYAKKYNGELINCDSRQIYNKLDIVNGKDLDKTSRIFMMVKKIDNYIIGYYETLNPQTKLWLYDVVDPHQKFSSFDYVRLCRYVIADIINRGKTPIIVGGTYLYLKQLLYGASCQTPPDWQLRKTLANYPIIKLQEILKSTAPHIFEKLNESDRRNPHRLIRKIEIAQQPPTIKSSIPPIQTDKLLFLGIKFPNQQAENAILKKRIADRLKQGAIAEIANLLQLGYKSTDPGLQTIGCQQIIAYLQKKISYEQMFELWLIKERQYAKRQLTFMKKDPHIVWQEYS